jgi:hypothetical protein
LNDFIFFSDCNGGDGKQTKLRIRVVINCNEISQSYQVFQWLQKKLIFLEAFFSISPSILQKLLLQVIFLESDIALETLIPPPPASNKAFDNEFCSEPILRNERFI